MAQHNQPASWRQLRSRFRQAEGLPFAELLPAVQIDESMKRAQARFRRRVFSPAVTVWTFLSQALSPDHSCADAVARLLSWFALQGRRLFSGDTSSYCAARQRLPLAAVQDLVRQTGRPSAPETRPEWLWKERHVKIVDGTTLTMPDTPANQKDFPQSSGQARGVGFPIGRLVVVFSLAWATALDLAFGATRGKSTGETTLFRTLWDVFDPGDILLADRLFDSYRDIAALRTRGVDSVIRMNAARHSDFRRGHRLGRRDHIVTWRRPPFDPDRFDRATYDALPELLTVRELHFTLDIPGVRSKRIVLVTTLLDATRYTRADLADLYRQRWHAELDLNALKTTLQMEHLRCQTPEAVRKEVWVHFLAYNLLRRRMADAACAAGILPRTLSFKGAVQLINAFAACFAARDVPPAQLLLLLMSLIARRRLPHRPGRVEPRKLKLRSQRYPHMTQPRSQERQRLAA